MDVHLLCKTVPMYNITKSGKKQTFMAIFMQKQTGNARKTFLWTEYGNGDKI